MVKALINKILRNFNLQINRYPNSDLKRRIHLIMNMNIDLIFDIGANDGGYALQMRELNYNGLIISFEPLSDIFKKLEKVSKKDTSWLVYNYALGNENGKSEINIAQNTYSSSILNMLPLHLKSAPESKFVSKENIEIRTFDKVIKDIDLDLSNRNALLKIDTQGFEKFVLEGAKKNLNLIKVIQIEMSIFELYQQETLFVDMINYMDMNGFELFSIENGHSDPITKQLLQVDGIFINKKYKF
jgi:FkbM family methyltransferase